VGFVRQVRILLRGPHAPVLHPFVNDLHFEVRHRDGERNPGEDHGDDDRVRQGSAIVRLAFLPGP